MLVNPKSFGKALKDRRESKGVTQKEMIDRVLDAYSDERAYRRIEKGDRLPDRTIIIRIAVEGLRETKVERIDELLHLGGYEGLSDREVAEMGLTRPVAEPTIVVSPPLLSELTPPEQSGPTWVSPRTGSHQFMNVGVMAISVLTLLTVLVFARPAHGWFIAASSGMYGALYVLSVLLESAWEAQGHRPRLTSAFVFCFMFSTSVLALVVDAGRAGAGDPRGFWVAALILAAAAVAQYPLACAALSDRAIVPTSFQSMTAQAAHLKNTIYFLSLVVFFWLPPYHCIAVMEHEISRGNNAAVQKTIAGGLVLSDIGAVYPSPGWLVVIFLLIAVACIPMGARLTENLSSGPAHNRYLVLFFSRALTYFLLGGLCLAWYSQSLADISRTK